MVYEVDVVKILWDYFLCDTKFILFFSICVMIQLKHQIILKDQNEIMSCLNNLLGLVDYKVCLKYAFYLYKNVPK